MIISFKKLRHLRQSALNKEISQIYDEAKPSFIHLMQKHFGRLTYQDIEELYDDAVLALYENANNGTLKELTCSITTYLYQIGRNKAIDKLRHEHPEKMVDIEIHDFYPFVDTCWNDDYKNEIRYLIADKVVRLISGSCKKLLDLFFLQETPMKVIASQLGYASADVVKDKKSRCLRKAHAIANENLKKLDE